MKEKEYYLNLARKTALSLLQKPVTTDDINYFINYIKICECFIQRLCTILEQDLVKKLENHGNMMALSYSLDYLSGNDKIDDYYNYYFLYLSITTGDCDPILTGPKISLFIPNDMFIVSQVLRDLFAYFKVKINPDISIDRRSMTIANRFSIDEIYDILNGMDNALENLISGAYRKFEYLYNNQLPYERTR